MKTQPQPPETFWIATRGEIYRQLVRERSAAGLRVYAEQEASLTRLFSGLTATACVLEFGCGYGRHAYALAATPHVRYTGFDISEAMLEPLRREPSARRPDSLRRARRDR